MSATFVPAKVLAALGRITPAQADTIPFGVVKLNQNGEVEMYNRYNVDNYTDFNGQDVIGKNYFTEVAPCSNNFMFSGRFKRGVESGELNSIFDYLFTYKIAPTKVRVHLFKDPVSKSFWIFTVKY